MSEEPQAMTLEEMAADKRVEAISVGLVGTSESAVATRLNDGRWQVVDLNGTSTAICTTEELKRFAILLTALVPAHQRDDTAELVEALTAWQDWMGRWQSNLYHNDLPNEAYDLLEGLVANARAALREAGIE